MELNPHDLLKIGTVEDLISYSPIPNWVTASLTNAPYVVVRRARAFEKLVAVGIRGSKRNERFAAFLPIERIVEHITPEKLAEERRWHGKSKEIFHCLEQVSEVLKNYQLPWGPAGSLGFELASEKEIVNKNSDIDIIIRSSAGLKVEIAKEIKQGLERIPIRLDVQIETDSGAFSLNEYTISEGKAVLLRTIDGPLLKAFCIS